MCDEHRQKAQVMQCKIVPVKTKRQPSCFLLGYQVEDMRAMYTKKIRDLEGKLKVNGPVSYWLVTSLEDEHVTLC